MEEIDIITVTKLSFKKQDKKRTKMCDILLKISKIICQLKREIGLVKIFLKLANTLETLRSN